MTRNIRQHGVIRRKAFARSVLRGGAAAGLAAGCLALLAGCGTYPDWLASSGPSQETVRGMDPGDDQAQLQAPQVQVVEVTDDVARRIRASLQQEAFSTVFGDAEPTGGRIGAGDVLEVSIWEASSTLFGASTAVGQATGAGARQTSLPEQMVNSKGTVNVPFVGAVRAAGRLPEEVEADITNRLKDKANQPQVLVRVIRNATSNATVVGEVKTSQRVPLTARGERLLDALAAAGGVTQPVAKTTLQLTRGSLVRTLPLDTIIRDPRQNVALQPGDVITAIFQPLSFTALGATDKNQEVNFEAQGITLAQALARVGGVADSRADARGVFIFRFEDPAALGAERTARGPVTPEGRIPVIYRVNLKDPATFFVAQSFPVRDKDVVYVANSPVAEWQKFLNVISSVVYPLYTIERLGRD